MKRIDFTDRDHVGAAAAAVGRVIDAGGTVLLPSESYYGLGADPRHDEAVNRVFGLKVRPGNLALPVVCADWQQVESLVRVPDAHRVRLSRIWPAALTIVAACRGTMQAAVDDTLAVRIPAHQLLRALLYRVGPLTATSANRHGEPPCVEVEGALGALQGAPDLVLDGGTLAGGKVSTLVDLTTNEARLIRPGPVAWEQHFDPEKVFSSDH